MCLAQAVLDRAVLHWVWEGLLGAWSIWKQQWELRSRLMKGMQAAMLHCASRLLELQQQGWLQWAICTGEAAIRAYRLECICRHESMVALRLLGEAVTTWRYASLCTRHDRLRVAQWMSASRSSVIRAVWTKWRCLAAHWGAKQATLNASATFGEEHTKLSAWR